MALFGNQKKMKAEDELWEKLADNPLIQIFIDGLKQEANAWTTTCTGYYDDCRRELQMAADMLAIFHDQEKKNVGIRYTNYGYEPMKGVTTSDDYYLDEARVFEVWGKIVAHDLQKEFPELKVQEPYSDSADGQRFVRITYYVPKPAFKKWV